MKETLVRLWHWLSTSRYCRHLEDEVLRLHKENRDLVNALLSANHLPMLPREDTSIAPPRMKSRMLPSQYRQKLEAFTMRTNPEEKQ